MRPVLYRSGGKPTDFCFCAYGTKTDEAEDCGTLSRAMDEYYSATCASDEKSVALAAARPVGADKSHLQLSLAPVEGGPALKAIWFGAADRAQGWRIGLPLRAWFTLAVDTFREPVPSLTLLDAEPL